MLKTTFLFFATVLCEIIGCFLPRFWLKRRVTAQLLIPAGISLAVFVWLLTLYPAASGCVYAAYGGVYVVTALLWLRIIDGIKLSLYSWSDAPMALYGMLIIMTGWGRAQRLFYDQTAFFWSLCLYGSSSVE